jgi:hypothetical protein
VTGLIGQIEVASPLTRHVAAQGDSGDDARVFFSLTANF